MKSISSAHPVFAARELLDRGQEAPPVAADHRIVIATLERIHGSTGVHTHTRMLHGGFTDAGFACRVVNPFCGSRKWLPIFGVRRVVLDHLSKTWGTRWYRHWHYLALRENLLRDLCDNPTGIVVAQCPTSARAALSVRDELQADFKIAHVCHFNHSEADEYRARGELSDEGVYQHMLKLESELLERVDQVIYVSQWAQQVVQDTRQIRPKKSSVIWNGISETLFGETFIGREEIGLRQDDLVLMNVGTLEPRKNQAALIDLFAEVSSECPQARLVLIGEGPDRRAIEKKLRVRGLKDKVKLLGHRSDVPVLLKLADIYVHYAKLENCPVALLEAARAGLPAAAIPVGGIVELQERLGSIVGLDEADVKTSLEALRPILKDAALRREISQRARRKFTEHFTRQAMVSAYLDALALR